MTKKMTKRDLAKYRKTIGSAWEITETNDALVRTFRFSRFVEAFMFVTRVGIHAEVMQQYPIIVLDGGDVSLTLSDKLTHTLTLDNFELAKKIDIIYALSTTNRE
jgi:4a-hydroxytetrahydrobiopterin dehydratase